MNLVELNQKFSSDDQCREFLVRLRWPEGVTCPRCKSKTISRLFTQSKFECAGCNYQFSVTAGTIFNDSHLPLTIWFMATLLLCEAKKGMSAHQLKRTLFGLHKGSYKTAWYLCHRIRAAMVESQKPLMGGVVEIDETYVGGKPRKGRPRREKDVVIGIRQRGGELRMIRVDSATSEAIKKIMAENISDDVDVIITDESAIYPW